MLIETHLIKKFNGTFSMVPWKFLNNIWATSVVPLNSMELKQQNVKFHGILSRSMKLLPYSRVPWNSMEFHGTFNFPPKFPYGTFLKFHGIPWNLINLIFKKIIFLNTVVGIWLMIICHLAKISKKRHILHWFRNRNSYFEHPSVSENEARSAKVAYS